MKGFHIHKGSPLEDWPVQICASVGSAHQLAIWLGSIERTNAIPPELRDLRVQLDAKLIQDPTSTQYLAAQGDSSKEHHLCLIKHQPAEAEAKPAKRLSARTPAKRTRRPLQG